MLVDELAIVELVVDELVVELEVVELEVVDELVVELEVVELEVVDELVVELEVVELEVVDELVVVDPSSKTQSLIWEMACWVVFETVWVPFPYGPDSSTVVPDFKEMSTTCPSSPEIMNVTV